MHHNKIGITSRLLIEFLSLAFLVCLGFIAYTMLVEKDFVVFTDPETIPEPIDFFANISQTLKELWMQ